MDKLNLIWIDAFDPVALWSIKNADDPMKARNVDAEKDAYDRKDNYNGQGVAVYAYVHLKAQIDAVFGAPAGHMKHFVQDSNRFIRYHRHAYLLDCFMPLLNFMIQESASHPFSQTLVQVGLEVSLFLVHMTEKTSETPFSHLGHFSKAHIDTVAFVHNMLKIMGHQ